MKAIVLRERGGPDVLQVEEWPEPVAGSGEVVVALRAAAVNHRDVWLRSGATGQSVTEPAVPGSDGSGEVVALGDHVDPAWKGAAVVINPSLDWGTDPRVQGPSWRILGIPDDGTYAEFIRIAATQIHRKPESLSFEQAAAIPLAGLTAYRALFTRARLQASDTVLVTGIGGGVALFALAMAVSRGARVIVTSGSDDKLARAANLGASGGVNYHHPDWPREIASLAGGSGPTVVIDGTAGAPLAKILDIVRPGARVVNYGGTAGPIPSLGTRSLFWKHVDLLGTTMGTPDEFAEMLRLYEGGAMQPIVDSVFPLAEAAAAHARMERADQFGKIVLKV